MSLPRQFISAVCAGLCVGFGGLVFLSVDSKPVGAALFTIGLFVICTMGFHLFTGKICYVFDNDRRYALALPVIWLGNLCGTGLTALLASLTRNGPALQERALALCQTKLGDGPLSLVLLGFLCNVCIYFAVEGFARNPHELGKYLSLFFGVMVFILSGTEHCVADMFYFWMAGLFSGKVLLCLLLITLGNALGGILLPLLRRLLSRPA